NATHDRPLAFVPIAAAADDNDQLAGGMRTQGGQHGFEGIRLMGIIDIDGAALRCRRHTLDAAVDTSQAADQLGNNLRLSPTADDEAHRGQQVIGLEQAGDREVDLMARTKELDHQRLAAAGWMLFKEADLATLAADADQLMMAVAANRGDFTGL